MIILRTILFAFTLVLLVTAPFAFKLELRNDQHDFDEQTRKYIALNGSDSGLYGDCSGASVLVPFAVMVYGVVLAVYAFITALFAKAQGHAAVLSQVIIIGVIGVLPMLLWLLRQLQRL